MKFIATLLIACSLMIQPGRLFAQVTDTLQRDTAVKDTARDITVLPDTVKKLRSNFVSFIPPAVFITYGLLSFEVKGIRDVDFSVYRDMQQDHPDFRTPADDFMQYAPLVAVYALNFAGVKGKNAFIDRTILLAISEGIFGASTAFLKVASDRERPDGSNRFSFPSGHTGNAFVSAEFLAQEFGERSAWYSIAGYSMATATAVLRVYNNKHWFSDIIAGAGFGILSVKAAYYFYPMFRNKIFKTDKGNKTTILLPSYQNGRAGFTFAAKF